MVHIVKNAGRKDAVLSINMDIPFGRNTGNALEKKTGEKVKKAKGSQDFTRTWRYLCSERKRDFFQP